MTTYTVITPVCAYFQKLKIEKCDRTCGVKQQKNASSVFLYLPSMVSIMYSMMIAVRVKGLKV